MTKAKKRHQIGFDWWIVIIVAVFALVILFLLYPLATLVIRAFQDPGSGAFTFANFLKFFSRPYYYNSFMNSVKVTVTVTLLCIGLGVPMAYLTTMFKIRFKRFLEILIIISMMSPPFIGAYSWIMLLGRNGVITNFLANVFGIHIGSIYGFAGIALVFTMKLYPYIYMFVSGALSKIDSSLLEASENLGCNPVKKVFTFVMPLILPTILAGAMMVFTNAFTDFGTPMMIGEGYRTMPVLVYTEYIGETGSAANFASALSIIMVFVTVVIFLVQRYFSERRSYEMTFLHPIEPKKMKPVRNVFAHIFLFGVASVSVLPQATIIISSFKNTSGAVYKEGWGFANYVKAFQKSSRAIVNTYEFAIIAIAIVLCLGVVISYISVRRRNVFTRLLDVITMFPLIISGTIMGIMMLQSFNGKPFYLGGTAIIMIMTFVVRRTPYTIRSGTAFLRQMSPSVEEASISLGCPPMKTFWKITLPLMMSGILSGLILSWITIIQELSASIILYTGRTATLSVSVYAEVTRNNFGVASALASILTVTVIASLMVFLRFSGRDSLTM